MFADAWPTVLYCGLAAFVVLAASLAAFLLGGFVVRRDPIQPPGVSNELFKDLVLTMHNLEWDVSDVRGRDDIQKIASMLIKSLDDEMRETRRQLGDEYYERRNEFWSAYLQNILACSLIVVLAILLLTKTIQADAGLPIMSAIAGFAVAKTTTGPKSKTAAVGRD